MRISRHFTTASQDPYATVPFRTASSEIRNPDGSLVFQADGIEVPAEWSQVAADGLTVVGGSRDGMDIQVKGPVSAIESAFHVTMGMYQHPTENRTFYSTDREPTTTLPFQLWHVSGLDNYSIPHPLYVKRSEAVAALGIDGRALVSHATTGSGPSASFLRIDLRASYSVSGSLTGAGQNLGLLEYSVTDLDDLNTYPTLAHQTN
jgi:hypothetical protein